ncbi:hypothetical protein KSP24_25015 [Paenibacillus sp. AK121]|uniref:hypothetical protein n=1 Tax=Bacteria TaxID=2 RepID=UPI001C238869|nr:MULTISPECIES: hypothetical protein [Bacteria]MBU9710137.1 hypothetical protein [Paenibacillus sp. AK121]MCW1920850.1 hypothetical protein [Rhodobacter sp. KR11]
MTGAAILATEDQLRRWAAAIADWDEGGEEAIAEIEDLLADLDAADQPPAVPLWQTVCDECHRPIGQAHTPTCPQDGIVTAADTPGGRPIRRADPAAAPKSGPDGADQSRTEGA